MNMKRNLVLIVLTLIFLLFVGEGESHAYNSASVSSAKLKTEIETKTVDKRTEILQKYLEEYNSPLSGSADKFIETADKYNLDWRLVAAISGLESGYGKHIPADSYNAWGWGIYGGKVTRFQSWDEGIEEISLGLRERYLQEIEYSDPYIIGPTYAASPTWAARVTGFMQSIENYRINEAREDLVLAL